MYLISQEMFQITYQLRLTKMEVNVFLQSINNQWGIYLHMEQ